MSFAAFLVLACLIVGCALAVRNDEYKTGVFWLVLGILILHIAPVFAKVSL